MYNRQIKIFNPINQKYKIIILGAGSLGSFITLNLAKLGFNNIEVWDYDIVEKHNIPNQFYRMKDINKYKVNALKEIVKDFSNIDIKIKNIKVDKNTKFPLDLNLIYILTFDSLEERKLLLKLEDCIVLDVRSGGEGYSIEVVNLFNKKDLNRWKKSFDITPAKLPCGEKSIIYTNLSVASEVCNIVKKINNNEKYPIKLYRNMKNYFIINNL